MVVLDGGAVAVVVVVVVAKSPLSVRPLSSLPPRQLLLLFPRLLSLSHFKRS